MSSVVLLQTSVKGVGVVGVEPSAAVVAAGADLQTEKENIFSFPLLNILHDLFITHVITAWFREKTLTIPQMVILDYGLDS